LLAGTTIDNLFTSSASRFSFEEFMNKRKCSLLILVCTAWFLGSIGCSRRAEQNGLTDAVVEIGPSSRDSRLELTPLPLNQMQDRLRINAPMATSDFLRATINISDLGESIGAQEIQELAKKLKLSHYSGKGNFLGTTFSSSVYPQAFVGEGELIAKPALREIAGDLQTAVSEINRLLLRSKKEYRWPTHLDTLEEGILAADRFIVWFSHGIAPLPINPLLKKPVVAAIGAEYGKARPFLLKASQNLEQAQSLGQAVSTVRNLAKGLNFEIPGETAKQLEAASSLARSLTAMKSSQEALGVVIQVWRLIPPEDRESVFRSRASEFYDFLKDKDDASLRCLEATFCLNPIIEVAKRVIILPKISEYGVQRLKGEINVASRDYLIATVLDFAADYFPTVPDLISREMQSQQRQYTALIQAVLRDFRGFVTPRLNKWAQAKFTRPLRMFPAPQIKVNLRSSRNVVTEAVNQKNTSSDAESVGLSLATAHLGLAPSEAELRHQLVEPILQLLSISGFRQTSGAIYPSLMFPLLGERSQVFDIKKLLQGKVPFAIPNQLSFQKNLQLNRATVKAASSVMSQAEILRGLARQIKFHRDWETNSFDSALGKYLAEELVAEAPQGAIGESIFPKSVIFSLAVGNAGALLQNIVLPSSPAFLLLPEGELLWGERYEEIGEGRISTVAGLVDIVNGQRASRVDTLAVARFSLALNEFIDATEGIENSNAAPLKERLDSGKTVLDEVVRARRYLRLFQLGLTNYLTSVAQTSRGGFRRYVDLSELGEPKKDSGGEDLITTATAIRALVASSNRFEMRVFSWAALDGYYFMNRNLWDRQWQFYRTSPEANAAPDLSQVSEVLMALHALKPFMPVGAQQQFENLANPWLRALAEW
jgi:hypothetical protein